MLYVKGITLIPQPATLTADKKDGGQARDTQPETRNSNFLFLPRVSEQSEDPDPRDPVNCLLLFHRGEIYSCNS